MNEVNKDIRWKQRFQSFEKSYRLLEKAVNISDPSEVERAGMIQFFEMCFELSWKLQKDYLEQQGFKIKSPREAIKQSYQFGLVSDGHTWMDALKDRNLTAHTYQEKTATEVTDKIKTQYFQILMDLYHHMKSLNEK